MTHYCIRCGQRYDRHVTDTYRDNLCTHCRASETTINENDDDILGKTLTTLATDAIIDAFSVLEALSRESTDGELPEWFRVEWLWEELVPLLREANGLICTRHDP